MYKIVVEDARELTSFLAINDVDYVDVLLNEKYAVLVTNSSELYTELRLPVVRSKDEIDFQCRIHKKTLASLEQGDYLVIGLKDGVVTAEFYNEYGGLSYSCIFEQQVVADSVYWEKMELVENVMEAKEFDTDMLVTMSKIAKMSTGVVNVDHRVASVFLRNGARVYRDVETSLSFSITSKALDALRKCAHRVADVRDFLLARSKRFCVLARKTRLTTNEEYFTIREYGAKFTSRVGLANLFKFMGRLKVVGESVELRVRSSDCCVADAHYEYRVPVVFEGSRLAPGAECETIAIPIVLLIGVLTALGYNQFDLRVTKNFNQFSADKYTVVW